MGRSSFMVFSSLPSSGNQEVTKQYFTLRFPHKRAATSFNSINVRRFDN
jgi:hypothetical protein